MICLIDPSKRNDLDTSYLDSLVAGRERRVG
jgi:hypothetical protein